MSALAIADRRWLLRLLGADNLADLTGPLTAAETARVDDIIARYDGDPVAALGELGANLPNDVTAGRKAATR